MGKIFTVWLCATMAVSTLMVMSSGEAADYGLVVFDEAAIWNAGDSWLYGCEWNGGSINHTVRIEDEGVQNYTVSVNGNYSYGSDYINMVSVSLFDIGNTSELRSDVNFTSNIPGNNFESNASFNPGLQYLNLPLTTGKKWNFTTFANVVSTDGFGTGEYPFESDTLTYAFFVSGTADVTVPAGTFATHVVLMNYSHASSPGTYYYRFYYSDEVKNVVRWETVNSEEGQGLPLYPQYLYFGLWGGELKDSPLVLLSYSIARVPRQPIRIDSNADFDAAHGVVNEATGDGSAGNPWLIENYEIDGAGYGCCIYVGNTTDYFVVRNCYLHEASGVWLYPYIAGVGLHLYNTTNGNLTGNVVNDNTRCIKLVNSNNNVISDNNVTIAGWSGIELDHSENVTINGNRVYNCTNDAGGVSVGYSPNATVIGNIVYNNSKGISVYASKYCTINNNTLMMNSIGIGGEYMEDWNTHSIDATNVVNGKPLYYLKNKKGGAVLPGAGGVILANCSGVAVQNQILYNVTMGIELGFSHNNTIDGNTFTSPPIRSGVGLALYKSMNNHLLNNTATLFWGEEGGVQLTLSENNTISCNSVSNNYRGVYLWNSKNNVMDNNTVTGSQEYGIHLAFTSSGCVMDNNTVSYNSAEGISTSAESAGCVIKSNHIHNNSQYGIDLESDGSLICGNTLSTNGWSGLIVQSSSDNNSIYHNNFFDNDGAQQAVDYGGNNTWDNGYPSGGNYWDDYAGVDLNGTPSQDAPPSDGIGDTPYGITSTATFEITDERPYIMTGLEVPWFPFYLDHGQILNHTLYMDAGGPLIKLAQGINYQLLWSSGEVQYMNAPIAGAEIVAYYNYTGLVTDVVYDNYPLMEPWEVTPSTIVAHAPIRIDSNADFDAAHGVVNEATGDGSVGNPWVIENYEINGTGYGYCIYVGNTTEYFVLRNCSLHESSGVSQWPFYTESGLLLYNVNNSLVLNNTLEDNLNGIHFFSSRSNYIQSNIINNNDRGINLQYSNSNVIQNNDVDNNYYGIILDCSGYNTLSNNSMIGDGIFIRSSAIDHWNTHNIDDSNTVEGKPVHYRKNVTAGSISSDAGQVILANCSMIDVSNLSLQYADAGIAHGRAARRDPFLFDPPLGHGRCTC